MSESNKSRRQIAIFLLFLLYLLLTGSIGMVHSIANALGEEIGWRGFLVPELFKTTGLTGTALFSGVVWALWHYPVLIGADYNAGTPTWYGLTCFTVMVLAISFIFAWMRLKIGKSMDCRPFARQPQPLRTIDIHTLDPQIRQYDLVLR
jgi:membrane protease YdiL (CAAX protease family)